MLSASTGVILLLLAALVPSQYWIDVLRATPSDLAPKLLAGAQLFRVSLASLGVFVLVGGRLGWWRRPTSSPAAPLRPTVDGETGGGPGRTEMALVLSLVAVGAALRLYRLGEGLWADEVVALVESVRLPVGELVTTYASQNQHFLYSLLANLSIAAFGETGWSLRLPAALFGIVTLWATWKFGRLVTSPREAVLALIVLTFSYQHIWFSQNARGYSALLFWTIVSSHFLIRALRERDRRLWLVYAGATTLGMYTHMTMVFVVAGQFAAYAWHVARTPSTPLRERVLPFFSGFGLAGLMTMVCYALVLPQIPEAAAADRSDVVIWRSPVWMLSELTQVAAAGPLTPLFVLAGLGIGGAGFVSYWRRSPTLPILFAVPVVSGAVAMIALGHHLWPRFFFFAAVFAILFAVRGLLVWTGVGGRILRWTPLRSSVVAAAIVVVGVAFLGRSLQFVYGPKQDYAGATAFVEASRQPGDVVVTVGGAAAPFRMYFAPDWGSVSTPADLQQSRSRSERTWLVYAIAIEVENSYPEIYRISREEFTLMGVFRGSLKGGEIYVYRSKGL